MSKVCVFFAPGLEECEGLLPVDLLRRAGAEVTVASITDSVTLTSSHGITLNCDCLASQVDLSAMDAIVLPGGLPGTTNLAACPLVLDAVKSFAADPDKLVAAICAAPSILGGLGLLQGKKATSHAGFRDKLTGADVVDEEVVIDGNIMTSRGLGAAIPFGLALVSRLVSPEKAEHIRSAIHYQWPI